jgi:HAD superfamily hydrolase (TIGR01490 family)
MADSQGSTHKDNSALPLSEAKGLSTQHPALVVAVFDVDRTLVPITTTERIYIRYLIRKRVIGLKAVLNTGLFMLRRLPQSPFETIRRERAYLSGLPYEQAEKLALDCFESDIKPRISQAGMEAIRDHKDKGHMVVLLSGSLDFLLEPMREYVGADHLIAAHMQVVKGKLTGRIEGQYPYGSVKAVVIRHFIEEHGLDFSQSYAYADHHSDHEVLSLFGNPVVINPKPKMREIAEREGWTIREFP